MRESKVSNTTVITWTSGRQVVLLVCLVKEMRLDLFLHKRDEKGFEAMLQVIVGVFGKHSDEETVLQCITTLNYCVDNGEDMMQVGPRPALLLRPLCRPLAPLGTQPPARRPA